MKRYCLPSSFVDEILPTIPADAQAVLFALLWHSDNTLKPVWPSVQTIAYRAGLKSENSARKQLKLLEEKRVIVKQKVDFGYKSKYGKSFTVKQNVYTFNLQYYIERDIAEHRAKAEDYTSERAAKAIAAETAEAMLQKLPQHLAQWLVHMEFTGNQNGTLHFKSKDKLPRSFVEQQFKKHGLKIVLAS